MRRILLSFFGLALTASVTVITGCSADELAVGSTDQALKLRRDGRPTGNGKACSWEGTAASDLRGVEPLSARRSYTIGERFRAPDACNECTCTARGIACTVRECGGGSPPYDPDAPVCDAMIHTCPDGSPAKYGPKCEPICDPPRACSDDAKLCPDGSSVGRTGPNCEFAPCPTPPDAPVCDAMLHTCPDGSPAKYGPKCEPICDEPRACTADAKECPDGSYVGRTGPNCEFAACPGENPTPPPDDFACTMDAKQCPDGSYVGRVPPSCEFAPCPR